MTLMGTLFGFQGRISRLTFWLCAGAVVLMDAAVLLFMQDWVQSAYPSAAQQARPSGSMLAMGLPVLLIVVISIWSGLALKVKRLHDRDRSGLFLLAGVIPVAGWLWLLWEIGLAPGKARGARFDRGGADDDDGRQDARDSWLAPALGGGLAPVAAGPTAPEVSNVAPRTSYGVIALPEAEPAAVDAPDPVIEAASEDEPASNPEAAGLAAHEPTPAETQAQIAAYLESVDHPIPPEPEPERAAPAPPLEAVVEGTSADGARGPAH